LNRTLDIQDADRIKTVQRIFNSVTPQYDLLNRLLSGRQDVYWRRRTVRHFPENSERVIDIATGTGDIALEAIKQHPEINVIGLDFVPRMLQFAAVKTKKANAEKHIGLIAGDALHIPFQNNYFDAATIAFGLRNIPDIPTALGEMQRVVRPGGKVLILEMTFPKNIGMRRFFNWYLNNIIPLLGRLISRDSGAYRYLPDSIQAFLSPGELSNLMEKVGLIEVKAIPLTFGITYLHEGVKPD
jgi:demethylmenaquinone methyltransferase / 2-methoxy-6-polyprenyl-1,4-benzoquinol methylase